LSNDACPVEAKSLAEITSIGSAVVVLLLWAVLVPVTTISCNACPPSSDKQHQF
jgi:hypothetical protein